MKEKDFSNEFKFVLKQGDVKYCEVVFDADQYNPFTRYSIDIRDILPRSITKLQKTLSKRRYDTVLNDIDLLQSRRDLVMSYPRYMRDGMSYNPKSITQHFDSKTIKGVEFKIGLYINNKPIVERVFYVDGFNSTSRWSVCMLETVNDVVDGIMEKIKETDVSNTWDDYDIINNFNYNIIEVRELPAYKRSSLLRRINRR
jgi:hypothetical protein